MLVQAEEMPILSLLLKKIVLTLNTRKMIMKPWSSLVVGNLEF
uniref:Uncharacterized protein n=1 Tax=Rhizophora mucronata TaxID=61149 RepID=A0A2P2R3D1_RHIMU